LEFAEKMKGFSGAQVVKVGQDAAKMAIINGENIIHKKYLETILSELNSTEK